MSRTLREMAREIRPHRTAVIVAILAATYFAVGGYLIDRQRAQTNELIQDVAQQTARIDRQNDTINAGRKVSSNAVCAFGSALAEAGRKILNQEERLHDQRRGAGQRYVSDIAERVERQTGIADLVVRHGPKAGQLDCARLQMEAKIK